jgi:hypothetical protein
MKPSLTVPFEQASPSTKERRTKCSPFKI